MPSRSLWTFLLFASLVAKVLWSSEATKCPDDVVSEVSNCIPSYVSYGVVRNLTVLQRLCRNGNFKQPVTCMTDLRYLCQNDTDQRELLSHSMDVDGWRASADTVCENEYVLKEHLSCWETSFNHSSKCIADEIEQLKQLGVGGAERGRSRSNITARAAALDKLRHMCSISTGILNCFQSSLREMCPPLVSRVLVNLYLNAQPPLCGLQKTEVAESDGDLPHPYKLAIVILCFLLMMAFFYL